MALHLGSVAEQSRRLTFPLLQPSRSFVSAVQFNNRQKEIKSPRCHPRAATIHLTPCSSSKQIEAGQSKEIARGRTAWSSQSLQGFPVLPIPHPGWEKNKRTDPDSSPALCTSPFPGWFSLTYIQQATLSPSVDSCWEEISSFLAFENKENHPKGPKVDSLKLQPGGRGDE